MTNLPASLHPVIVAARDMCAPFVATDLEARLAAAPDPVAVVTRIMVEMMEQHAMTVEGQAVLARVILNGGAPVDA